MIRLRKLSDWLKKSIFPLIFFLILILFAFATLFLTLFAYKTPLSLGFQATLITLLSLNILINTCLTTSMPLSKKAHIVDFSALIIYFMFVILSQTLAFAPN